MSIFEYGIPRPGVHPSSMMPPQMGSQPARFTMPPIVASAAMSFEDQKRFERFTHLGPPTFSGAVGEDAYEFLMDCREKLHNLGSLESHGVAYITYKFRDAAIGGGHLLVADLLVRRR